MTPAVFAGACAAPGSASGFALRATPEKGLTTSGDHDRGEKLTNLQPHPACKYVILPLAWGKIGFGDLPVKDEDQSAFDVLDLEPDGPTYVIVTNPPSQTSFGDVDQERSELLEAWRHKGVVVVGSEESEA